MDVDKLLAVLPGDFSRDIDPLTLVEVVMDLGRPILFKHLNYIIKVPEFIITKEYLNSTLKQVGEFGPDNRTGIDGTLHRITRLLNRKGETIGLTCRVGKVVEGNIELLRQYLDQEFNVLLVGTPSSGKTTSIRNIAKHLSTYRSVVIVDKSNEIGGDGNIPHPAIGDARRLQVPFLSNQTTKIIEAIESHSPEVIVCDEISNKEECSAIRTAAERGVQIIATVHGDSLESLIRNPSLNDLLGGVEVVTLGDQTAYERGSNKTIRERPFDPSFDVVIELREFDEIAVFEDVQLAVDTILGGGLFDPEVKRLIPDGQGGKKVITISKPKPLPTILNPSSKPKRK